VIELCGGCGHTLDGHLRRECPKTEDGQPCPCKVGLRSDVWSNAQLAAIGRKLDMTIAALNALISLVQAATGLEVHAAPADGERPSAEPRSLIHRV
jgi:hypothetical protein